MTVKQMTKYRKWQLLSRGELISNTQFDSLATCENNTHEGQHHSSAELREGTKDMKRLRGKKRKVLDVDLIEQN